jgi:hypothetical protein
VIHVQKELLHIYRPQFDWGLKTRGFCIWTSRVGCIHSVKELNLIHLIKPYSLQICRVILAAMVAMAIYFESYGCYTSLLTIRVPNETSDAQNH